MLVERNGRAVRRRRCHRLTNTPSGSFGVFNSSVVNLEKAVLERLFYVRNRDPLVPGEFVPTPAPEPGAFHTLIPIQNRLLRFMPTTTPLSYDQFVDSYRGRKRTIYSNAVDSLLRRPVDRRDLRLKAFVKCEKTDFGSKVPVPRLIQPRDPRYNVELGCFVKPLEHKLYRSIDKLCGRRVVMKGRNMSQRGLAARRLWDHYDVSCGIDVDIERLDQHISIPYLNHEHRFYVHSHHKADRSWLQQLLSGQLHNHGVGTASDGSVEYRREGSRTSGEMTTASGNVLGVSEISIGLLEHLGLEKTFLNDGDDMVFVLHQRDVDRFLEAAPAWFRRFGFTIKVGPVARTFEQIKFCKASPVWTPQGWVFIRDPTPALHKDAMCLKLLESPGVFLRWCASIGDCGMSLTGGIPIVQNWYRALQRAGLGQRPLEDPAFETGFFQMSKGMTRVFSEVHPGTRASFYLAFGLDAAEQLAAERRLDALVLSYGRGVCDPNVSGHDYATTQLLAH